MKKILITILGILCLAPVLTFAAPPSYRLERSLLPEANNTYDLGTSTSVVGSVKWWRNIFFRGNLTNDQMSDGCASWVSGVLTSLGVACGSGSGGGSGGGTWSTTTSQVANQLINYSNNATDIVTIGATATTTAKFYFDPNTARSFLGTYASSTFLSVSGNSYFGTGAFNSGFGGETNPASTIEVRVKSTGTGFGGTSGTGAIRDSFSSGYGVGIDTWDSGLPRWGILNYNADTPTVMMEGIYNTTDVVFNAGNVGIGSTSPKFNLGVRGNVGANNIYATNIFATGTVASVLPYASSTALSVSGTTYLATGNLGSVQIGSGISPQLDAFGTKPYELQIQGSINDVVGGAIYNRSTGSNAAAGLFFQNANSPIGGIGATQTYYAGMAYAGSQWNGAPLGFGALPANGFVVYNTDGKLILGSATSTGEIDLYTGAGSFGGGIPDAVLTSAGNFGVATSTLLARLSVHLNSGESMRNAFTIGSSTQTATTTLFTVLNTGYTGIGTTTPGTVLAVVGDTYTTGRTTSREFVSTSTISSNVFPYASTTMLTASIASSTNFIAGLGAASTPGYSFSGLSNTGMYATAAGAVLLTSNGTAGISISSAGAAALGFGVLNQTNPLAGGFRFGQTGQLTWSTTASGGDIGLTRDAAGVLRVSDSGTGGGSLKAEYFTGTSTTVASTFPYASTTMITAQTASTTNLIVSGVPSSLLRTSTGGIVSGAANGTDYSLISALSCSAGQHLNSAAANGTFTCSADTGSGGGGSAGTFSTSSLAAYGGVYNNYANNATDVVEFGGTSGTTTAKYWFDPNASTYYLGGSGTTTGKFSAGGVITAPQFNATGTVASILPYASSTAITASGIIYTGDFLALGSTTLQNFTGRNSTTTNATTTSLGITNAPSALLLTDSNGSVGKYAGVTCTNQFLRALSGVGGSTCATVANTDLANSTISGIALGANLADLTATNATLTFSGTYNGSAARTIGLNLGNANIWTALQSFTNADAILATGSTTLQNFTGVNATTTNATTTSLFSSVASSTNLYSTNSFLGNLSSGSTTLQNFTARTSTTTNATTTSLFSSVASSTNLYSTNSFLGNLSSGSTSLQNFTAVNGTTTNATSTTMSASSFCLGGDCKSAWPSAGGGVYPFVPASTYNTISSGTSTPLWLQGSPFSLFASTTAVFTYASSTALSVSSLISGNCVQASTGGLLTTTGSACGAGGGASPDWNKQTTYNVFSLTPTTTIAVWLKDKLFASSTAIIDGDVDFASSSIKSVASTASTTIPHLDAGAHVSDFDPGIFNIFDIRGLSAAANTLTSGCINASGSTTPNLCIFGNPDGSGGFNKQRVGIGSTTPSFGDLVVESLNTATTTIVHGSKQKPSCDQYFSVQTGAPFRTYMSEGGALVTESGYCKTN